MPDETITFTCSRDELCLMLATVCDQTVEHYEALGIAMLCSEAGWDKLLKIVQDPTALSLARSYMDAKKAAS